MVGEEKTYDVLIIGAGIMGNCAAYHCAKDGLSVLQLEQFSWKHHRGSSHGQSRIIRYAHHIKEWIDIVKDTYEQIDQLERKRHEQLWVNCGLLWMGKIPYVEKLARTLRSANCECDVFSTEYIQRRFPQFVYDDSHSGLWDPKGGYILADKWMDAFHEEFIASGGEFRDETEVLKYYKEDGIVKVHTTKGTFKTRKLIIAAGCWVNKLVPELHVKSKNIALSVCYWKTKSEDDAYLTKADRMPVFIVDDNGKGYFAIPECDYKEAIKVSVLLKRECAEHGGEEFASGEEPEHHSSLYTDRPAEHMRKHFPLFDADKPHKVDYCKYTMSPDGKYIIDYFDDEKQIILCAMMSGTGFKVAPAVGKALSCMTQNKPIPFDMSLFKLSRFNNS